jgi:hypothetical protein
MTAPSAALWSVWLARKSCPYIAPGATGRAGAWRQSRSESRHAGGAGARLQNKAFVRNRQRIVMLQS